MRALRAAVDAVAWAGLLWVLVLLGRTVGPRLGAPYDLEWMEGGMLVHAARVADGLPLYVRPGPDFIPFIYPPLYHAVLGAWGALAGGVDYLPGRVLSVLGVALAALALAAAARAEGLRAGAAAAAVAAFASTYEDVGAFFDLVRIDGLGLGLWAAALVAVRRGHLRTGGLLLVAAFATKHHAAAAGLPALVWLWQTAGRAAALRFAAWSVGPACAFMAGMAFEGDGAFFTYLLGVPAGHPFVVARALWGAPGELARGLPLSVGALALAFGAAAWARRSGSGAAPGAADGRRYWLWQGGLAVALAMVMRGHHGGFLNVLMPAFWALALGGALAAGAVSARWPRLGLALALGLAGQGAARGWEPARFTPPAGAAEAHARVVERLRALPGPLLAPWSPWLPVQAGHAPGFHLIALWDVDHDRGPYGDSLGPITQAFAAQRWAGVLVGNDGRGGQLKLGFPDAYQAGPRVAPAGNLLQTRSGWRTGPTSVWVPRAAAGGEPPPADAPARRAP